MNVPRKSLQRRLVCMNFSMESLKRFLIDRKWEKENEKKEKKKEKKKWT